MTADETTRGVDWATCAGRSPMCGALYSFDEEWQDQPSRIGKRRLHRQINFSVYVLRASAHIVDNICSRYNEGDTQTSLRR